MSEENSREAEGGDHPSAVSGQRREASPLGPQAAGYMQSAISHQPSAITCPFCHGSDVDLFSLFGSQLLTSEYYCRNCRTVFEQVKR